MPACSGASAIGATFLGAWCDGGEWCRASAAGSWQPVPGPQGLVPLPDCRAPEPQDVAKLQHGNYSSVNVPAVVNGGRGAGLPGQGEFAEDCGVGYRVTNAVPQRSRPAHHRRESTATIPVDHAAAPLTHGGDPTDAALWSGKEEHPVNCGGFSTPGPQARGYCLPTAAGPCPRRARRRRRGRGRRRASRSRRGPRRRPLVRRPSWPAAVESRIDRWPSSFTQMFTARTPAR